MAGMTERKVRCSLIRYPAIAQIECAIRDAVPSEKQRGSVDFAVWASMPETLRGPAIRGAVSEEQDD